MLSLVCFSLSYDELTNIKNYDFNDPSILLVGAGYIGKQYAKTLHLMGMKNVTICSNSPESSIPLASEYGFSALSGGFEKNIPNQNPDLIILATSITELLPCLNLALENGNKKILLEKPGSLYSSELDKISKKNNCNNVRLAYNRLVYPNHHLLKELINKDGGITSCHFTFTEWISKINFKKEKSEVYERWGIANSLHVISMAYDLIGMPSQINSIQHGELDWHLSGSIFVGSGISDNSIPFSYHADWNSGGRWGIEIMTNENAYRLIPLEDLFVSKKDSTSWEKISFKKSYPEAKQGIAEEIAIMLNDDLNKKIDLPSIQQATKFIKIAEKIFGY